MMLHRLKSITKNQTGFTLVELLVALVIATSVVTAATMVIFQVFEGEARSSNHIDAISRVQNAGYRISTDTGMAQTWERTDDEDGFPLTLYWTEWESNDTHEVVYSIEGNTLKRVHSSDAGEETRIFEYILSTHPDTGELITYCEWDETNLKFNFTLTAIVGIGSQQERETRVYEVKPRPSI